jgi:alpha-L-fucosidase
VGPKPNGEIQIEQEALLRELALWNFVNGESIHHSRAFNITSEKDIWFTRSGQDSTTVFAFVLGGDAWKYGERKELVINCLQGSDKTKVSVLGYGSELVEYREGFDAKVYVQPTQLGLLVSAVNGQRLYTNNKWPNPVVLKIENVHFVDKQKKEKAKSKIDGAL